LNNSLTFQTLEINEVHRILEICNFHIKNGLANFEEKQIKYTVFLNFTKNILKSNLPFIVCKENKSILGFAYLSKFRNKSGYRYTFEDTVYVDNNYIGKGIGSLLLNHLIKESLQNSQIKNIIAVIGGNKNEASIRIHQKNGFDMIGTLKKVGFKKNQWLDSIYMQKILNKNINSKDI
tara:strand:- start:72 stop:605 length:534 start_codon:yes stop_codon:yes gene_type:complete